jgi:ribonuclease HI
LNSVMNELMLFTDGSVNNQSKTGYGASLLLTEQGLSLNFIKALVKVRRFEDTSSTKLELQTLLWGLQDIKIGSRVIAYTDSQNIMGLQERRGRFEQRDYRSKNNRPLNNKTLYQDFFRKIDQLDFNVIKVNGHQPSHRKNAIGKIFTLVDKASRNAMRKESI